MKNLDILNLINKTIDTHITNENCVLIKKTIKTDTINLFGLTIKDRIDESYLLMKKQRITNNASEVQTYLDIVSEFEVLYFEHSELITDLKPIYKNITKQVVSSLCYSNSFHILTDEDIKLEIKNTVKEIMFNKGFEYQKSITSTLFDLFKDDRINLDELTKILYIQD